MDTLRVATRGRGLVEVTSDVRKLVARRAIASGVCTVYVQHTSASLVIQENADPTVCSDLERWLDRLVPDGDPMYRHVSEGPDDMPAHVKAALLPTSLSIPVIDGDLALGTWQGIYLFEHRRAGSTRSVLVHVSG